MPATGSLPALEPGQAMRPVVEIIDMVSNEAAMPPEDRAATVLTHLFKRAIGTSKIEGRLLRREKRTAFYGALDAVADMLDRSILLRTFAKMSDDAHHQPNSAESVWIGNSPGWVN